MSVFDSLPPEKKEMGLRRYRKNIELPPLNFRAVEGEGVRLEDVRDRIVRADEGTEGYMLD
jgi:hypothetical protein